MCCYWNVFRSPGRLPLRNKPGTPFCTWCGLCNCLGGAVNVARSDQGGDVLCGGDGGVAALGRLVGLDGRNFCARGPGRRLGCLQCSRGHSPTNRAPNRALVCRGEGLREASWQQNALAMCCHSPAAGAGATGARPVVVVGCTRSGAGGSTAGTAVRLWEARLRGALWLCPAQPGSLCSAQAWQTLHEGLAWGGWADQRSGGHRGHCLWGRRRRGLKGSWGSGGGPTGTRRGANRRRGADRRRGAGNSVGCSLRGGRGSLQRGKASRGGLLEPPPAPCGAVRRCRGTCRQHQGRDQPRSAPISPFWRCHMGWLGQGQVGRASVRPRVDASSTSRAPSRRASRKSSCRAKAR